MSEQTSPAIAPAEDVLAENARLRRHLEFLSEAIQTAASILDPEVVMEITLDRIGKLISSETWTLLLYRPETQDLVFKVVMGDKVPGLEGNTLAIGEGVAGWVARERQPALVNDPSLDPRFLKRIDSKTQFTTRNLLALPLLSRGQLIGVVEVLNKRGSLPFTDEDLRLVRVFTDPAAVAIHNAQLFKKTEELTITDDCTRLFNARYLNVYLENEVSKAVRYNYPVSVIFMDLDGFKAVNDTYGHLVGSRTLGVVGDILLKSVRNVDVVARYGGDEFTIVLPNTPLEGALYTAERIRRMVAEFDYEKALGVPFRLSGSLGVSAYPEHGSTKLELLRKADQAMYTAKERNKNNVVAAS